MTEQQQKSIAASRKQRAAYFAWQNAPAGEQSIAALNAYCAASAEQRALETSNDRA
jgi:hypothetical protein